MNLSNDNNSFHGGLFEGNSRRLVGTGKRNINRGERRKEGERRGRGEKNLLKEAKLMKTSALGWVEQATLISS